MNGGKDVKIGHDKRPISVIPNDEQPLYNFNSGQILTDEFGNPLITEVDQFFTQDASKKRATSVVLPELPENKYIIPSVTQVGVSTATMGVDLDVELVVNSTTKTLPVLTINNGTVNVGILTALLSASNPLVGTGITSVQFSPSFNKVEVRTINDTGDEKNNLYFPESDITYISGVTVGNKVSGTNIPDGAFVLDKSYDKISISKDVTTGIATEKVTFFNSNTRIYTADNVLKVQEQFAETSEVSTTLLGIPRAETQLSLFSNVSSYGVNSDEWETFTFNTGVSRESWDTRYNKTYGRRYLSRIEEETQESAIKLSAFPPPYSFPFGINYDKINLYDPDLFEKYKNFIILGNDAYNYFSNTPGYTVQFASQFLSPEHVRIENTEIVYETIPSLENDVNRKFDFAFAKIDAWTDTWRSLNSGIPDPVTGEVLNYSSLKDTLANSIYQTKVLDATNTQPGYKDNYGRYSAIQSRRVFRYQPGRISGFTFGVRSSAENVGGVIIEWGISNETDAYMFKIYAGQLSIIRRSTVPLSTDILKRNGLDPTEISSVQINGVTYPTVQPEIPSGDPFDVTDEQGPFRQTEIDSFQNDPNFEERRRLYHTIEITRDKFNGDPLNGNGPSGYNILPQNVTMWKIEFGWYGAIGARFYAYIPSGAGEARWVVVHTLVIENQLGGPCLRDSYFRFKYSLNVTNNAQLRTPQYIYKYGASYYIDGGDEGTTEIYSVDTGANPKQITSASETSLFAIRPKDLIINSNGLGIDNRKLIIPTKFSMSTNTLTEVKVRTCKGCQGHGHVFTPGVATTETGRNVQLEFVSGNTVNIVGTGASFTPEDLGAKLIAPSLFNVYITGFDESTLVPHPSGFKSYTSAYVHGWGKGLDGYPNYNTIDRPIGGVKTKDYSTMVGNTGITTTIGVTDATTGVGGTYPHPVRLSNYDVHFASDFPLSGSSIKIQFMNPIPHDQSSLSNVNNTHWADFMIGVTDKKPTVTGADELLGWDASVVPWTDYGNESGGYVGQGNTTILPESEILFGESTHSWANMDEDGIEVGEAWAPTNFRSRMGEDVRIPNVTSESGGGCSTLFIDINTEIDIVVGAIQEYRDTKPDGTPSTPIAGQFKHYLVIEKGQFAGGINDWLGGSVAYRNLNGTVNTTSTAKYEDNEPTNFVRNDEPSQFITLSASVKQSQNGKDDSNLTIVGRSVRLRGSRLNEGGGTTPKIKLFTYNVYPLYLVGKLMDNAAINNITITESSLNFKKTTSPQLYISKDSKGVINKVSNKGLNDQTPPTNFVEVERLSSASIDTQNRRPLRTTITKDIFYIGEDETKEIDMTKVFGIDRNVITPDNNNVEATFITAKQLGSGNAKFVQGSLNFKEQ